jgi:hypothetical protein
MSGAGDVNGDGLADVIVGAPRADPNGLDKAGRSYVVFGKADTDGVSLTDVAQGVGGFAIDGEAEGLGYAGHSVSGAGDVNGDGLADVMVGMWRADPGGLENAGRTYVVLGKASTETISLADVSLGIGGFVLDGEAEHDKSGESLSAAGDVNGDGLADVVVGAPSANANGVDSGRTYVVFGKTDGEVVSLAEVTLGIGGFVLDGEAEYDGSGESVATAGDVNGDGLVDLILSAPKLDPESPDPCLVYVVFGKESPGNVALSEVAQGIGGFTLKGEYAYDGCSVSGAGDVNADGLADVIVGADGASPNGHDSSGRTYLVFGKEDTDEVSLSWVAQGLGGGFALDGQAENDGSGRSVSGAGDINADGLADIVVGARGVDANYVVNSGRTYVVFGKTATEKVGLLDVAQGIGGFAIDGEAEADGAGGPVTGAWDVNGDGVPDVVVAARWADPNGIRSGRNYVVFGGDFSCEGG